MPMQLANEATFTVGTPTFVDAVSPDGGRAIVFEDDGTTGYLYAIEPPGDDMRIVDAMHVYNVANVSDRDVPSTVQLGWSEDSQRAVLLINGYPHAAVDFATRRGFCRTEFPPPGAGWTRHGWTVEVDEVLR